MRRKQIPALAALVLVAAGCTPFAGISTDQAATAGRLSGDVDGDGQVDQIALEGDSHCDWNVVVRTRDQALTAPLDLFCEKSPAIRLLGLAEIDGEAGFEIVVEHDHGASRQWGDVLTLERGRLVAIRERPDEELWRTGGSVGTGSDVTDCAAEPGVIVRSNVDWVNEIISRGWWRVDGSRIRLERRERRPLAAMEGFPEFRSMTRPFSSCRRPG